MQLPSHDSRIGWVRLVMGIVDSSKLMTGNMQRLPVMRQKREREDTEYNEGETNTAFPKTFDFCFLYRVSLSSWHGLPDLLPSLLCNTDKLPNQLWLQRRAAVL